MTKTVRVHETGEPEVMRIEDIATAYGRQPMLVSWQKMRQAAELWDREKALAKSWTFPTLPEMRTWAIKEQLAVYTSGIEL